MIEHFGILAIGVALGIAFAAAVDRHQRALIERERAELARHQALPPEATTGDTVRLAPYGAQPAIDDQVDGKIWLPDDIRQGRHVLRIVARRRPK